MKTKKLKLILIMMILAVTTSIAGNYQVKKEQSSVKWNGKKVTGEHHGIINIQDGVIKVEDGKITGGTFVVDMKSITNEDLTGEWNQKLVDHLKSDDFFGVETYPTSKLVVNGVKHKSGKTHTFSGDLTIKGITHPVSFDADVSLAGDVIEATGELVIDRTNYNVRYGSGKFFENLGDRMINDEFRLEYSIVASK